MQPIWSKWPYRQLKVIDFAIHLILLKLSLSNERTLWISFFQTLVCSSSNLIFPLFPKRKAPTWFSFLAEGKDWHRIEHLIYLDLGIDETTHNFLQTFLTSFKLSKLPRYLIMRSSVYNRWETVEEALLILMPWLCLSIANRRENIFRDKMKRKCDKGSPCLIPWEGSKELAFLPSAVRYIQQNLVS